MPNRQESVELLQQPGWKAWTLYSSAGGPNIVRHWKLTNVNVSYISYNTSTAQNEVVAYEGNEANVLAKWKSVINDAGAYPYAEAKSTLDAYRQNYGKPGAATQLPNWPNSYYVTQLAALVFGLSDNSNTFVRDILLETELPATLPNGLIYPGAKLPLKDINTWFHKAWVFKAQQPFPGDLAQGLYPPRPK